MMLAATSASAFTLRSPQVTFNTVPLQGYFTSISEPINAGTDQVNAQTWSTTIAGASSFTILLKGNPANSAVGVYNSLDPNPVPAPANLYQVFPAGATAGWTATCFFSGGNMSVALFDQLHMFQGSTLFTGVDQNHFSFYLSKTVLNVTTGYYGQDYRNAGSAAQVLTYAGVRNYGDWFECFETSAYSASSTFDGVVLDLQSVLPTPTRSNSWGELKNRYR